MSKKHQPRRAKGAPAAKPQLPPAARIEAPQEVAQGVPDEPEQEAGQQATMHEASEPAIAAAMTAEEVATGQQAAEQVAMEHEATAPVAAADADTRHSSAKQQGIKQQATKQQGAKQQGRPANRRDSQPGSRQDTVQEPQADIRGVLIQLAGARLLLPNATIAEVLSYAPPEPVESAPDWLLGKIRWRGWQLPLVAFAELAGVGKEPAGLGSKVVVLKALGGNAKAPYFAILSQGFPRLVTVAQQGLVEDSDGVELPLAVHSRVIMNEDTAFVPDLGAVESLITDALAQAA